MVRTAVRRKAPTTRRESPKKKTQPTSKQEAHQARIANFSKQLNHFLQSIQKEYGPSDKRCKAIRQIATHISNESRKKNSITEKLTANLKKLAAAYRNISKTPKSLKNSHLQLQKFIKEHVQKETKQVLSQMKKDLSVCEKEISAVEKQLKSDVRTASKKKIQYKVDQNLQKKFSSLSTKLAQNKTRWAKVMNTLAANATAPIKRSVQSLKNQMNKVQKQFKNCLTLTGRHTKAVKKRAGFQQRDLFTAARYQSAERFFGGMKKECDQHLTQAKAQIEQLKACKHL